MTKFLRGLFERSRISRNTTPKLIAGLFALVLWLYVMGEVNPETNIMINDLNVELLNVEEIRESGLVVIGQEDFTVNASIIGRRNEVYKLSGADIKVTADLRGFQQGVNSIPLEISQPANVSRVEISPQQIKIRLDKVVRNQKPVEILTKGKAEIGYDMGKMLITPSEVLVEGPESKVNSVAKVVGEIDIEKATENIRSNIPIKAVDNEGNVITGVDVKTSYVNVFAPILKVRNVTINPQLEGTIKEGYIITSIDVYPKLVALRGKNEIVQNYSEVLTEPINIDDLDHTIQTKINLVIPENIETPQLSDVPEVTINVEKIESKEFTFTSNQISVNNINDELTTNIEEMDLSIKVKVSDVRSVLENIRRSDLEVFIDATELEEGTQRVSLNVNTNIAINDIEILPSQIDIEIQRKNVENNIEEGINQNDNNTNNQNNNN